MWGKGRWQVASGKEIQTWPGVATRTYEVNYAPHVSRNLIMAIYRFKIATNNWNKVTQNRILFRVSYNCHTHTHI